MVRSASISVNWFLYSADESFSNWTGCTVLSATAKVSSLDQFVAMLFCQVAQAMSLRGISGALACTMLKLRHLGKKDAPNKITPSYANKHRSRIVA